MTDPRVLRSHAKVLEAATELLVDGGPRALTVDAVSERSGVAKSTMYRHFPSRTDLMVEVLRHNMPATEDEIPEGTFEEALRALVQRVATTASNPEWGRILPALITLKSTIADIDELSESDRSARLHLLQEVLNRGIDEGLVCPKTDPVMVMSVIFGPIVFAALYGESGRMEELADLVVDQFIAGCRERTN